MEMYYTVERNVQMLIYLMKQHGIKKVIASPGTTNITLIASLQQDSYFEMYSVADERSAAYMACGLAAETGEPVAISCTGATASRNYIPALTEAFYRKLPILAITSTQHTGKIGQLCPQLIDRSVIQKDIAVMSIEVPFISNIDDEWACNVKLNSALLALKHKGGGPVHINLTTTYSSDFSVKELPETRVIRRITLGDVMPQINSKRIGIFVGSHNIWDEKLISLVERFCEIYNGVVICDHTSNYHGKYRVQYNLICGQHMMKSDIGNIDLIIDLGEMSGAYMSLNPTNVWRINNDGVIRDTFKHLTYLFEMEEEAFFKMYVDGVTSHSNMEFYVECQNLYDEIVNNIPELPFSNIWIAQQTAKLLPDNSVVHLGILNTLRSWNFFELPDNIPCFSNTGGFGIDGIVSSLIGASLANKEKLYFGIVGDLAFFYDMNAIANHNVGNNVRILLINNGCGTEFKNYSHFAAQFGDSADKYIAARGHYGNQSKKLVKNYAENLGFKYMSASSKEEYMKNVAQFVYSCNIEKPILFEVFTSPEDESDALNKMSHIIIEQPSTKEKVKRIARNIIGEKGIGTIKNLIGR